MPVRGPTREAYYAHLKANPPYGHTFWQAYVVACTRSGLWSKEPQFGRWLAHKHPERFVEDFEAWKKTLPATVESRFARH